MERTDSVLNIFDFEMLCGKPNGRCFRRKAILQTPCMPAVAEAVFSLWFQLNGLSREPFLTDKGAENKTLSRICLCL